VSVPSLPTITSLPESGRAERAVGQRQVGVGKAGHRLVERDCQQRRIAKFKRCRSSPGSRSAAACPPPLPAPKVSVPPTASVALGSGTASSTGTAGGITGGTVAVDNNGSGQPVSMPVSVSGQTSLMQPYTGVNYIICVNGIFPSRQ
jgi:hypothetical protein